MDTAKFNAILNETFDHLTYLSKTKGVEYARDTDRLANFKRAASEYGITTEQAWGVFWGKHVDAIKSFVRNGKVLSEPIEGRIDDAILYLILLKCILEEKNGPTVNPPELNGTSFILTQPVTRYSPAPDEGN